MQLTGKELATWVSIATALAGVVATNVDARARVEFNTARITKLEAALEDTRAEGRVTRDMAIETRSQVGQILAAVARMENKLDTRIVVSPAHGGQQ